MFSGFRNESINFVTKFLNSNINDTYIFEFIIFLWFCEVFRFKTRILNMTWRLVFHFDADDDNWMAGVQKGVTPIFCFLQEARKTPSFLNWGFGFHNRRSAWPSRQKRGYRNARTIFFIWIKNLEKWSKNMSVHVKCRSAYFFNNKFLC